MNGTGENKPFVMMYCRVVKVENSVSGLRVGVGGGVKRRRFGGV